MKQATPIRIDARHSEVLAKVGGRLMADILLRDGASVKVVPAENPNVKGENTK